MDGIPHDSKEPQMNARHHQTEHQSKMRRFWLKEETVLGTLAAFLAFAHIYAFTGDADLYYPFVGALGMGAVIYTVAWLAAHSKP
jgi:hypothetical protein